MNIPTVTTRPRAVMRSLVLALAIVASGCGDRDQEPEAGALGGVSDAAMDTTPAGTPAPPSPEVVQEAQQREIVAELDEWTVELSSSEIAAGEITFHAMNRGTHRHALEVEGQGIEEETEPIEPGEMAMLTVTLTPGTYEVYCPVVDERNHKEQGMTTTLTVR